MYYEINVSQHGSHVFATAERSLTTEHKALQLFHEFTRKFPVSLGYKIMLSRIEKTEYFVQETN